MQDESSIISPFSLSKGGCLCFFSGLLHEAGFSCYPLKFEISLSKLRLKIVDWFLAVFIAILTYVSRLTSSGAGFILNYALFHVIGCLQHVTFSG